MASLITCNNSQNLSKNPGYLCQKLLVFFFFRRPCPKKVMKDKEFEESAVVYHSVKYNFHLILAGS